MTQNAERQRKDKGRKTEKVRDKENVRLNSDDDSRSFGERCRRSSYLSLGHPTAETLPTSKRERLAALFL